MRHAILSGVATASLLLAAAASHAEDSLEVEMHWVSADGIEASIGTITLQDTDHGLLLTPELSEIPPGIYGFHVHEHASCEPGEDDAGEMGAARQAGGHYDPDGTGRHEGPYGDGHLGDLPVLTVDRDGQATLPVLAPRLSLADMHGRSLMIHEGGDNYADDPEPLGGGGGRMACGVVES
ncbi:superoxide dismutase family protein [Halomonas heilongjiangensis]|uniref:Superoxide dismutase [Cu-Zn] n=1 Tax=Halomonas heilongjiangensis TaxID=1387883 RepID=A0A2N7TLW1_9GAMM|nr:superoxide dismutase family protein [Halomonas heilongjiangensis]PMR69169.1 superoxide dismutase [Halomonas heilongjiangensis]PXX94195.1 superoxide dismutase [Halomonas heilongjiangensis]